MSLFERFARVGVVVVGFVVDIVIDDMSVVDVAADDDVTVVAAVAVYEA